MVWSLCALQAGPKGKPQPLWLVSAGCSRDPVAELAKVPLHTGHEASGIQLCTAGNWVHLEMIFRLKSRK